MILVSFTVFRETYAPLILKRKAEALRRYTNDSRYQTMHERLDEHKSFFSVLAKALTRPLRLLMFHPLIQLTSLLQAFTYGLMCT